MMEPIPTRYVNGWTVERRTGTSFCRTFNNETREQVHGNVYFYTDGEVVLYRLDGTKEILREKK